MKDYFKVYEDDLLEGYRAYVDKMLTGPHSNEQYLFIQKLWTDWYGYDFVIRGHRYTAVWEDRPLGYRLIKVKSINTHMDRCAIENEDGSQYILFDLHTKSFIDYVTGGRNYSFYVVNIREYHIDPGEEALIRLTL